jgi:hypothetical protein
VELENEIQFHFQDWRWANELARFPKASII